MSNNTISICSNQGKKILVSFPKNTIIGNDNRSVFAFSENNKKYRAKNINNKIGCMLQIDGKLYSNGTKKCDNGLLLEDNRFFLIEFKGVDVSSACKQLLVTLKLLKQDYKSCSFDFFCRVIAKTGVPKVCTSKRILIQELGSKEKFLSKENLLEEEI